VERAALAQLRSIGITDAALAGIREAAEDASGAPPDVEGTVERPLVFIVTEREEAEEWRKLDTARVLSEEECDRASPAASPRERLVAHVRTGGTAAEAATE